jgi:hypothetical protein
VPWRAQGLARFARAGDSDASQLAPQMDCAVSPRAGAPPHLAVRAVGALRQCVERRCQVSASFQCATAVIGSRMIARLVAKRAEASPLVRARHRS